jgi:hypothetical protein
MGPPTTQHVFTSTAQTSGPSLEGYSPNIGGPSRLSGPVTVEGILEEEARQRFGKSAIRQSRKFSTDGSPGLNVKLTLSSENIFSTTSARHTLSEMGLTPGEPESLKRAQHWISTHFRAIHHNTPFLSLPDILRTATTVFGAPLPDTVLPPEHDEVALMYAILAVGSLREQTYDSQARKYRSFHDPTQTGSKEMHGRTGTGHTVSTSSTTRATTSLSLFNLATLELDSVDQSSETAVQALYILHTFISNTSMGRRSKDYVARAVTMSHELGLNRQIPLDLSEAKRSKYDQHRTRRRAMLYLYVYFSDVYVFLCIS